MSLKYIGEIERGEANATIEVYERLAQAMQWDSGEMFGGVQGSLAEGIREPLIFRTRTSSIG